MVYSWLFCVWPLFMKERWGQGFDTSGLTILELDFWIQDSDDDSSSDWRFDTQLLSINGDKLGDLGGQLMAPSLPIHHTVAGKRQIWCSFKSSERITMWNYSFRDCI
ncbi:hypothetical protein CEXT_114121 [Caerostris extrusa]|uniref:Uncharacterized protein n=1 Tax=Caerostris extrusa TaxID=172846 RepID=A0AAV4REY2_CAEEX|nr:hypothetical protein CEXT_114121 [Caerostris extrusa]